MLQVLDQGLSGAGVPYSYGFAIILLTILVKLATYPLSKQQVTCGFMLALIASAAHQPDSCVTRIAHLGRSAFAVVESINMQLPCRWNQQLPCRTSHLV